MKFISIQYTLGIFRYLLLYTYILQLLQLLKTITVTQYEICFENIIVKIRGEYRTYPEQQ